MSRTPIYKLLRKGMVVGVSMWFEGEKLVDDAVEILENPKRTDKTVYVYSPYLRANIFLPKRELCVR